MAGCAPRLPVCNRRSSESPRLLPWGQQLIPNCFAKRRGEARSRHGAKLAGRPSTRDSALWSHDLPLATARCCPSDAPCPAFGSPAAPPLHTEHERRGDILRQVRVPHGGRTTRSTWTRPALVCHTQGEDFGKGDGPHGATVSVWTRGVKLEKVKQLKSKLETKCEHNRDTTGRRGSLAASSHVWPQRRRLPRWTGQTSHPHSHDTDTELLLTLVGYYAAVTKRDTLLTLLP